MTDRATGADDGGLAPARPDPGVAAGVGALSGPTGPAVAIGPTGPAEAAGLTGGSGGSATAIATAVGDDGDPGRAHLDPEAPERGGNGGSGGEGPRTRRARLLEAASARGVPLAAILTVAAVVVIVYLAGIVLYRLREIVLLVVVAGFVSLLLNPLVVGVQRGGRVTRGRLPALGFLARRGVAVAVVSLGALLVFIGLATAFGYPLVDSVTHFASRLDSYVRAAEHGTGFVGRLVRRYHVESWVKKNAPRLESYARDLAKPALSVGKGAAALVVAMAAMFMLVLLMLLEGPRLRQGVIDMVAPRHRAHVVRVSGAVARSVTGYMFGNFLTSLVAGVVVFVAMVSLRLPYAPLWGLWVGLLDFLPMIGGAIAGIPAVLFALVAGGVVPAVVLAVVFVAYSLIENHVLNPVIMSRTVHISPLLVLVAVLVGADLGDLVDGIFGGLVATLLAIPVASAVQVLLREVWQSTRPEEPVGPVP